jgi:hypothetical protein
MLSFPIMFYPKVLEGDTQPWVFAAAVVALLTFRTDRFATRRDVPLILLSVLCIVAYAVRSTSQFELLRNTYTYLAFVIFWVVCEREDGDYFPLAIKATVVIWFAVGLCQYILIKLGYTIESGRYMPGRSGVPSLTAEASYYGSLSMLHLMYLLAEKKARNGIFIACAVASVVLSGSVLAMLLLLFPLRKLRPTYRMGALVAIPLLVVGDYYLSQAGVLARLHDITSDASNTTSYFLDASLNLRVGHTYFTLFEHLIPSLLLIGPIDFMAQYNNWAQNSGLFIDTGSNYVLPALGEMVYGAGILALALLALFLRRALSNCSTRGAKLERLTFILACMLNPISISNIFLLIYAESRE